MSEEVPKHTIALYQDFEAAQIFSTQATNLKSAWYNPSP